MNLKKVLFIIFVIFFIPCFAQISQSEAIGILKQSVLNNYWSEKEIFVSSEIVPKATTIQIKDSFVISPSFSSWFFFIDDYPLTDWFHPCRYVFVSVVDGNCVIQSQTSPPSNFSNLIVVNRINYPIQINPNSFYNISNSKSPTCPMSDNYAVIISGGYDSVNNWPRYWHNCSAIYQTLVSVYNYDRNKIFVLMSDGTNPANDFNIGTIDDTNCASFPLDLDGDGTDDVNYSATKANITRVFDSISRKIKHNEGVFVFITDHGGIGSTICLWDGTKMTKNEFQLELNKLSLAKNVILFGAQCYGGGYTTLKRHNIVVSSSCSSTEYSWSRSRSLANSNYGEFCYHWVSAVAGQTPDNSTPINADFNADGHVSIEEAFQYARNNDAWANTLPTSEFHETPQYYSNKPSLGASMDLNGVFDHSCFGIDLYTRDNLMDNGNEPLRDTIDGISDSPDIWLRNYQDGITIHQTAIRGTNYLYVRIHNAGTDTSYSTDSIRLLYSPVFSTIHNFNPANWSELLVASLPRIAAGRDTILCFPVYFSLPTSISYMNHVLYSRINSPFDPLHTSETNLYGFNVIHNNNISLKKVKVTNYLLSPNIFGLDANFMTNAISPDNPYSDFRLNFNVNDLNILNEAEVTIVFPEDLMIDWTPSSESLRQITANTYLVTGETVELTDVPETDITLRYNFLTRRDEPYVIYKNNITQYVRSGESEEIIGGLTIQVEKPERSAESRFHANAGNDTAILIGTNATLHATQINENATYRWYDKERNFKYEGLNFTVTPTETSEYILEVTAESYGYRDLDTMKVNVVPGCIRSITPNPVSDNWVTVSYEYASTVTSAHLYIYNTGTTTLVGNYDLSNLDNVGSLDVEVTNYPTGSYTVVLACDNAVCHSKVLIRQ